MLDPFPTPCGLAMTEPATLGKAVVAAWDAFLNVVDGADLSRPSRLDGHSGRDVCVHLGTWEDHHVMSGLVAAARAGGGPEHPTGQDDSARLLRTHAKATQDQVREALQRSRDGVATWFTDLAEAEELGHHAVRSSVGVLPLLSVVNAGSYELAVHALDLAPCGAPEPDPLLLQRGLAALMDVTGRLAAHSAIHQTVTAQTAEGGWAFTSDGAGWVVREQAPGAFEGVGVTGTAADLLDASAGRAHVPVLLVQRRLKVQDLPGFMTLAPIVNDVPGLPGGAALRAGVNGVAAVTGGVSKVLGRFRR